LAFSVQSRLHITLNKIWRRERTAYDRRRLRPKWQQRWAAEPRSYAARGRLLGKPKYYVLGDAALFQRQLHMHVRNYSIGDALAHNVDARLQRAAPHGWDAFGLPAEETPRSRNNTPPREWTLANIAAMKRQMERLGLGYDWPPR